jgi:hypothetical protein
VLALWRDFQAAFRNMWVWAGILLSAVALYELGGRTVSLPANDLAERIVTAYRTIFHPVVDMMLGWLPLKLTSAIKDGVVIYLSLGGAVARTFVALTEEVKDGDVHADPLLDPFVGAPVRRLLGAALSGLFWPVMALLLWTRPIVVRFQPVMYPGTRQKRWWRRRRMLRREAASYAVKARANKTFDHDLRVVFILQVSAVFAVVGAMAGLAVLEG